MSEQVSRGLRDGEVQFLTDDMDVDRNVLSIFLGGNGDWYVGVHPQDEAGVRSFVRVRTSGVAVDGMPSLIAQLYRLLLSQVSP